MEAIIKSKEDLRKLVVIRVISGMASVNALAVTFPSTLSLVISGNITPYDDNFLIMMASEKAVVTAMKNGLVTLNSLLGP